MCEEDVQSERLADEAFGVIVTVFLSVHYAFRPWLLVSFLLLLVVAWSEKFRRASDSNHRIGEGQKSLGDRS
jgi:hypothetical protein